ncbi:MAG: hypothetical protein V7L05_24995 [Nostoc sp.]
MSSTELKISQASLENLKLGAIAMESLTAIAPIFALEILTI